MICKLKSFLKNEDGVITVDWVVLTAIVCGLAVVAVGAIYNGSDAMGNNVEVFLTETTLEELRVLE